jgi:hypothetical protein
MEIRAMENVIHNIENLNWSAITEEMHKHGYAVIPNLLTDLQCDLLKDGYNDSRIVLSDKSSRSFYYTSY